jgi:hypothetical protein
MRSFESVAFGSAPAKRIFAAHIGQLTIGKESCGVVC